MNDDVPGVSGIELQYGRPPRRLKRRFALVAIVFAAVVAGVFAFKLVQDLRPRLLVLAAQRRCLSISYPPGQIAYEEDPASAQLLSGNKLGGPGWTTFSSSARGVIAFYLKPVELQQFVDWKSAPVVTFDLFSDFLYIGRHKAKGSEERIVHIGVTSFRDFALRPSFVQGGSWPKRINGEFDVLRWEVLKPATLSRGAMRLANGTWGDKTIHVTMPFPLRLYVGQSDPADESRFTIKGSTPQGPILIDGRLQSNDQVVFFSQ